MLRISEIVPGDELLGWQKTGFALEIGRTAKGVIYRSAPSKSRQKTSNGLYRWRGVCLTNDTENQILQCMVTNMGPKTLVSFNDGLPVQIPYAVLYKLRRLSAFSYPGAPSYVDRPDLAKALISENRPYRTATEVIIDVVPGVAVTPALLEFIDGDDVIFDDEENAGFL